MRSHPSSPSPSDPTSPRPGEPGRLGRFPALLASLASLGVMAGFLAAAALVVAAAAPAPVVTAAELGGQKLFERESCNLCHGVSSVGIEAKVKAEAMRGPDLSKVPERDTELLLDYLRQKAEIDGVKHKKGFKGSDEELGALVAWLNEQRQP